MRGAQKLQDESHEHEESRLRHLLTEANLHASRAEMVAVKLSIPSATRLDKPVDMQTLLLRALMERAPLQTAEPDHNAVPLLQTCAQAALAREIEVQRLDLICKWNGCKLATPPQHPTHLWCSDDVALHRLIAHFLTQTSAPTVHALALGSSLPQETETPLNAVVQVLTCTL